MGLSPIDLKYSFFNHGQELDNFNDSSLFLGLDTEATDIVLFSSTNVTAFNAIKSMNEVTEKRSRKRFLLGSCHIAQAVETIQSENSLAWKRPAK